MGVRGEVEITIKDGNITIEAHGIKGKGCKDLTKALEAAAGVTIEDISKSELNEREAEVNASNRAGIRSSR